MPSTISGTGRPQMSSTRTPMMCVLFILSDCAMVFSL